MAIQAVILDFGGVLYKQPNVRWVSFLQKILRVRHNEMLDFLLTPPHESQFLMDIWTGKISEQEVKEMLVKRWKIHPKIANFFSQRYENHKRLNRELIKFIEGIRPYLKTAILSNAGTDAHRQFTQIYGLDRLVDHIIISAQVGIAKPDERIYHLTLDRLGVLPAEAVFIDDRIENILAARQLGMQAIQFMSTHQTINELKLLLGQL